MRLCKITNGRLSFPFLKQTSLKLKSKQKETRIRVSSTSPGCSLALLYSLCFHEIDSFLYPSGKALGLSSIVPSSGPGFAVIITQ